MKDLYWASVDEKSQSLLELPKGSLSSVFREDRRRSGSEAIACAKIAIQEVIIRE
jgi:hypothetical protein